MCFSCKLTSYAYKINYGIQNQTDMQLWMYYCMYILCELLETPDNSGGLNKDLQVEAHKYNS